MVVASKLSLWEEGYNAFVREHEKTADPAVFQSFLKERATCEEAKRSCVILQEDSSQKYGSDTTIGGKSIIPAKWIGRMMENMDSFVAVGNFTMKGAPETIGLAWFAVKLVMAGIQNNYNLYALFGQGLTDISELMVLIKHYDRLYDERLKENWSASDVVAKLFQHIRDAYAAILNFSFSVKKHLSVGKLGKMRHAFKDMFGAEVPKFQARLGAIQGKKKEILEASEAAFQEKTFQKLEGVQSVVDRVHEDVQDIKAFQTAAVEMHQEAMDKADAILKAVEAVAGSTKPKTRYDWARQDFEKNKKLLNPLPDTEKTIFEEYANQRHSGTCEWPFRLGPYKDWVQSKNGFLCLHGDSGFGKSVLLSTITEQLQKDLASDPDHVLQYFSCDATAYVTGSEAVDGIAQSSSRILNTLIFRLYELALRDQDDPVPLEKCNEAFKNPKAKDKKSKGSQPHSVPGGTMKAQKEDVIPEFGDAMEAISTRLRLKVTIVLDAVDRINIPEQEAFYRALKDLLGREDINIKILMSTRPVGPMYSKYTADGHPSLDIGKHNRPDIEVTLKSELDTFTGWTQAERDEAFETIRDNSGSLFKYISKVAIPFLRQPWRRPLSSHLADMPEGMNGAYKQFLKQLTPNYFELLKTALTWLLLAKSSVKVAEIMDDYIGTYYHPEDEGDIPSEPSENEDSQALMFGTQIQVEQLRHAGGPFLEVEETENVKVVRLKDPLQVRQFCVLEPDSPKFPGSPRRMNSQLYTCARCRGASATQTLFETDKEGHLELALAMVRHLNSPLFQKRFDLLIDEEKMNSSGNGPDDSVASDGEANKNNSSASGDMKQGDNDQLKVHGHNEAIEAEEANSGGIPDATIGNNKDGGDENAAADATEADEEGNQKSEKDDEESMDSDENSAFGWAPDDEDATSIKSDDGPAAPWYETSMRYEILSWAYHMRAAEELWSKEERENEDRWTELLDGLDRFVRESPAAWKRYQTKYLAVVDDNVFLLGDEYFSPLHVAAILGLTSWAERLLDHGASLSEVRCYRTPLQAAAKADKKSLEMLTLLLERGADPNFETEETMSAFNSWIYHDPSLEAIQLFLRYGGSVMESDNDLKASPLHLFALTGSDVAAFKVLLESGSDINGVDVYGETPLHNLLGRYSNSIPLDLLQAFVENGADVDFEDKESQRPLHEAARLGEHQAIKAIISKVDDVDDPDVRGRTALHEAALGGHLEAVKTLLSDRAKPNEVDRHSKTPLFFACLGKSPETAKYILDRLVHDNFSIEEINKATKIGRTPFRAAAQQGFTDVVEYLAKELPKEKIDEPDVRRGRTALHVAAMRGRTDVVKILLAHGAGLSKKDGPERNGKTPLELCHEQWAANGTKAFENTIASLIEHDTSTAAQDANLLAAAAFNGSKKILEMLHYAKADLNRPDQYGWTPVLLARHLGHKEAEEFLAKSTTTIGSMPTKWVSSFSEVKISDNGLGLSFSGEGTPWRCTVFADAPLPARSDVTYFEVSLKAKEDDKVNPNDTQWIEFAIGVATHSSTNYLTYPGYGSPRHHNHWAYTGDAGFVSSGAQNSWIGIHQYGPGDTVGCGVDFSTGTTFFTKGGKKLPGGYDKVKGRLFPLVGLREKVSIETNFGQMPFLWNGSDNDSSEKKE